MAELDTLEEAFRQSLLQDKALEQSFAPPPEKVPKSDLVTELTPEQGFDFEDAFQKEIDRELALSSSLDQALPQAPDEQAKVRQLSQKTGFPEEAIQVDKPAFEQRARKEEIRTLLGPETPATNGFLSDPLFASIAHDEAEALADIERKSKM